MIDASQTQNVTFSAGNGPHVILAGAGDVIQAGNGPTTIYGAAGATLKAGSGPDTFYGAPNERLLGGNGPDTFVFTGQFGANNIANFHASNDKFSLINLNLRTWPQSKPIPTSPDRTPSSLTLTIRRTRLP